MERTVEVAYNTESARAIESYGCIFTKGNRKKHLAIVGWKCSMDDGRPFACVRVCVERDEAFG